MNRKRPGEAKSNEPVKFSNKSIEEVKKEAAALEEEITRLGICHSKIQS